MSYTNVAVLTALATALGAVLAAVGKFVIPIIKLKSGESRDLRDMQIKSITEERASLQEQSKAAREDMLRQIEQLRIELVKSQQLTLSLSVENATLRTRQQQAEAMLRQLQNQLALRSDVASDAYTDGILTVDSHGVVIGMNRMISTTFGYSQDELIGHPLTLLIPEEYRLQHERAFQQQLSGNRELACVARSVRGVRKDGSYVDLTVTISKTVLQGRTVFTAMIREQLAVDAMSPVTSAEAAANSQVSGMITQVAPAMAVSGSDQPGPVPPSFPPAQSPASPAAETQS
jgi:PAS domain S-box-containing protein